jgi:hypothetical protein
MTLGGLSEDDLEGIRTGAVGDPTVGQVVALAGVFGVEPSYMLDRGEPVFDAELVEALRDETVRETIREILDPGDENIAYSYSAPAWIATPEIAKRVGRFLTC